MTDLIDTVSAWIVEKGLMGVILILFWASIKVVGTSIYNAILSKKIMLDIQRSYKVKSIIQRAEKARLLTGANRVLVTQLHNGERWFSGNHIFKLSLMQELSIDDPDGLYRTKVFDKQLNGVLVSQLNPLLTIASTKRSYDIISTQDLREQDFAFYRHLKIDKISYIITIKIPHKETILGYVLLIFTNGTIPERQKEHMNKLVELGIQIGDVLK